LDADTLDADLVALADSVLQSASSGEIFEKASNALFTVSGPQIVALAVLFRVDTLSEAQSLSFFAASERAFELDALSIGNRVV
jgi:hypothetical protein